MSGLLKQLQNPKGKGGSSTGDIVLEPTLTNIQDRVNRHSTHKQETARSEKREAPPQPQQNDTEQTRIIEAERLMAELLAESQAPIASPKPTVEPQVLSPSSAAPPMEHSAPARDFASQTDSGPKPGKSSQLKIVRKRATGIKTMTPQPAAIKDDNLPWWLKDEKKTTPQVELLVPAARKMLNDVLPSEGDFTINIADAVKKAVQLATAALSGEIRITSVDQEQAEKELLSLLTGKGPLQPLYDDPAVTDIFIDDYKSIKVIRRGQAIETPFYFRSPEEYKAYAAGMLQQVERVLNMSSPIVDCVLPDAWRSRINAVDASLIDGDQPRICIRVPRLQQISFYDILQTKTLPATLAAWLAEVVACGDANILVLGATGSGKTVMTTALLSAVGSDERIITIEDVPEVFVPTAHLEKLVARPPNASGQGNVKMPELLRAALRRAPHRIVVGEIRDEEARLFLRALETGHAGSIATIHADSGKDCLWRLLDLVQAYETSPQESIMRRIGRALHILIAMKKVQGKPCLVEVGEVMPAKNGDFRVATLVKFAGMKDGKRQWRLMRTRSFWLDKIRERGLELQPGPGLLPPEPGQEQEEDDE